METGAPKTNPLDDSEVMEAIRKSTPLPSSGVVNWQKKTPVKYKPWTQKSSLSCMAFDYARQLSVQVFTLTGVWIDFSPSSFYQLRENKEIGGMNVLHSHMLMETRGISLEALMKSQGLTETQINAVKRSELANDVALSFAKAIVKMSYVPKNMESIAQVLESGKAVGLLIFGSEAGYARKVPIVIGDMTYENAEIRHKITIVDYFLDASGTKKLLVNDSAHFGGFSEREITADFLSKRGVLCDYIKEFKLDPNVDYPSQYNFQVNLKLGDRSNEVSKLQQFLKNQEFFPQTQEITNFYGPITAKAVLAWQLVNKVGTPEDLNALNGEHFGPASRLVANRSSGIRFPDTGGEDVPSIPYHGVV